MANKLTLDDVFEHLVDQIATRRVTDGDIADTKQAILQWVADTLIGDDSDTPNVMIAMEHNRQLKTLKAHGWKEN